MTAVKNFEDPNDFLSFNESYIYDNYLPHYNLIKTIEHLRDKSLGLIDALRAKLSFFQYSKSSTSTMG